MTALIDRGRLMAGALVLVCACASDASAQYFGRNKVQYKKLDFQILKTEHFDIYFYPSEQEGVEIAARMAERWLARLEKIFGHQLRGRQPLVLYASHVDFEQTNTTPGEVGEGTGGFTEPLRRRIVLPLGGPLADTDHVIGHELVHAFQFDITTRPGASAGETGANRLPLWFIEGMAEYLTLGPVDSNTAMWLRDAVRQDGRDPRKSTLPTVSDLDNPKYFPYRWGQAFWAYVAGKWGDDVIGEMLRVAGATGDPEIAMQRMLGVSKKEFSEEWHAAIHHIYDPIVAATMPPLEAGRLTIKGADLGGDLNVGPAISPDGKLVSFLSERSLFSIDLFVAEVATGKILRKLTNTASSPHYSSLQFIYSAGAWDASSRRIAIGTVTGGKPAIAVFDAITGDKEREIRVEGVDELFNPTWAPDGQSIAFTGMSRGLTDLYVFDLRSSTVRALTTDPYADIQPAWSPDGRFIAFATDRFTSALDNLQFGAYRLALIELASGKIQPIEGPAVGKTINPQWAPDSRALYFISDRDGVSNLYRVDLAGGLSQLTALSTGISGITGSSPALSVASRAGIGAFTVYDQGNYHIYTRNLSDAKAVPDIVGSKAATNAPMPAAILPPLERVPSDVVATLTNATMGLPAAQAYDVQPYKSGLRLDSIGQPFIGIGADRFGAAIGGGLSMTFSDMLGNHTLATAFQMEAGLGGSYSFKNTAAQAMYLNQASRWNWGIVGGQVPYISGGFQRTLESFQNQLAVVDRTILYRQTDRSAAAIVAYPLDRAQRLEFQGGASQISFDQIIQTEAYSYNTGRLLFENSQEISVAEPLSLATSSAAFVHDTSSFGATSPVQGQRFRFEAAPTFGTLNYTSMTADYRRYFMPVSFYTIAVRAMHYGRYGPGGQDPRLYPLFLGYPSLVHGYDVNTFDPGECAPTVVSDCPAFDRLMGSRILVANVEFRFPLLRPFGASQGMYGPLPVEVAFFTDTGVAWDRGQQPDFLGGGREAVSSTGVALRANLMGFAIGEFAFSRPWQRPGKGWVFQFNLAPGF
jgi:hypothetical protein